MKRYALFAFPDYYPGGGWNDFIDSFDTVDEARSTTTCFHRYYEVEVEPENRQIVDLHTGQEVDSAVGKTWTSTIVKGGRL